MASLSRIIAPVISGTSGFLTNVTEAVMFGLGVLSVILMLVMYTSIDVSALTGGSGGGGGGGGGKLSGDGSTTEELSVPLRSAEVATGQPESPRENSRL
jgi:hypothetical protein